MSLQLHEIEIYRFQITFIGENLLLIEIKIPADPLYKCRQRVGGYSGEGNDSPFRKKAVNVVPFLSKNRGRTIHFFV